MSDGRPPRTTGLRRRLLIYNLSLAVPPPLAALAALYFVARAAGAAILWQRFEEMAVLLVGFGLLMIILGWRLAAQLLRPILELRRGAEIVSRVNPDHRITLGSGDELEDLADEINRMAENLARTRSELEARVAVATRTLQEERNRLATVLRTMVDGVIAANEAGEIILMNPRARILLQREASAGIGAALTSLLPGDRLNFHLRRIRRGWEPGREVVEEVIFPLCDGKLLRGFLSVVPGPAGERAGFLLVFRDLSRPAAEEAGFEERLREMPPLLRGPVAAARSLIEILQRHQEMPAARQQTFLAALAEELERLTGRVSAIEEAVTRAATARWATVAADPRELLEEAVAGVAGLPVSIEAAAGPLPPVLVEPFSWVAALRSVLRWIAQRSPEPPAVAAHLRVEDEGVVTTFRIGHPFAAVLAELETLEVAPAGEEPFRLGAAVRNNRGELWIRGGVEGCEVRLALLPAGVADAGRTGGWPSAGEPEFYDFDLFLPRPTFERKELLQADLTALEYVVFDTETTGLQLSRGDRVVSISAVRIRSQRVQNADVFHTLVNPGRPIPNDSVQFHHIEDHMVVDAPTMSEVYPQFVAYLGDAILVAHNAAFDKKCLDLAAAEAGLPQIDNPILDTLFLSYSLHGGTDGHGLDAMAERMGIAIAGRHTSLGDARATAQVFLGLLDLLPGRGVRTLAEAKAFCDRHLLLRWQSSRF